MNSVEIYIKVNDEYKRIDLFKDETITVNSSVQNINDLSKVFTDYSQSFTIPASPNNNMIFNYWNENGVNQGFDHRIRYDGIIELNTIPFRQGKFQIEKATEVNNEMESFTITFYGNTKQIKDLFKEEELSVLDYSSLNHTYNYANVIGRIDGSISDNVRYPIIGSENRYEYLTGTLRDVTIGGALSQSVVFSDLFPAIPVSKIFDFIANRYGITFSGVFLTSTYFTELYLYCKNSENLINFTPPVLINWTSTDAYFPELDLTTDKYYLKWTWADNTTDAFYQQTWVGITPTNLAIQYRVIQKIYDNPAYPQGAVYNTYDGLVGVQSILVLETLQSNSTFARYTFEVESATPMTFNAEIYNVKFKSGGAPPNSQERRGYSPTMSTANEINIQTYIPKIKVVDFFTGIIKMFNLTIIPKGKSEFELLPLDFFYAYGNYIDINPYVITDKVELNRPKLFKKLSFAHEKSENIFNNAFRNLFNRDYGDLSYQDLMSNESSSYEIKSPFEDVMFEKTTGYDFVTATLIDKDQKAYKPKPLLMYMDENINLPTPIKFYDGSGYNNVSTYRKFSNEIMIGGSIVSLNWGEEQSVNQPTALASNSLFFLWYKSYIEQLYDIRCRIVNLKTKIPDTLLSSIKLNDKLIYKDKKYIINNFNSNLTNGEVDFELITDFSPIEGIFTPRPFYNLTADAQDIRVTLLIGNNEALDASYNGTPIFGSLVTGDINFTLSIPENVTADFLQTQIQVDYFNNSVITSTRYITILQQP